MRAALLTLAASTRAARALASLPAMRAALMTHSATAPPPVWARRAGVATRAAAPKAADAAPPAPHSPPAGASSAPDFVPRHTVKALMGADGGARRAGDTTTVRGWVRTCRPQKARAFLEVADGSTATGLQVVIEPGVEGWDEVASGATPTGAAVRVEGVLVESRGGGQAVELKASALAVVGACDAGAYPLQKKRHTLEFLRDVAHLRPRTKTLGAVARVRSALAHATHDFYRAAGFALVHTPIISAADCEGAGEAFQVTTLLAGVDAALAAGGRPAEGALAAADAAVVAAGAAVRGAKAGGAAADLGPLLAALAAAKDAAAALKDRAAAAAGPARTPTSLDYASDFFGAKAYLTVSGQLQGEAAACALGDIYTFGPTFRAENSNTSRHLAEFWMVEPEMAFAGLGEAMAACEAHVRHCMAHVLEHCADDLSALDAAAGGGLIDRVTRMATTKYHVLPYADAVKALLASGVRFEFEPAFGRDLAAEHEKWLTDVAFGGDPVFVTDWPAAIKAFYMRANDDEAQTVAAMDLLAPRVGELAGGSAREERLDRLLAAMDAAGVDRAPLWWYADLRRFGSVPHAGFGVGFERLVQLATGVDNIRDVALFPRYPGHAEF